VFVYVTEKTKIRRWQLIEESITMKIAASMAPMIEWKAFCVNISEIEAHLVMWNIKLEEDDAVGLFIKRGDACAWIPHYPLHSH